MNNLWFLVTHPRNALNVIDNTLNYYGMSRYPAWLDYIWNYLRTPIQPWLPSTFEANEIIPGLWLGNWASATHREELKSRGITHIMTAIYGSYATFPSDFTYKLVPLRDIPEQDMTNELLDETSDYIHEVLSSDNKILIHCSYGKSRSSSLVIAYLIKYHDYSFERARLFVKEKRELIEPNPGFQYRLKNYSVRRTQSCIF